MPNMCLIRPADANEATFAWKAAIMRAEGPMMLELTMQNLPIFDRSKQGSAEGVLKGAYILHEDKLTLYYNKEHQPVTQPDIILIATGSEVQFALDAQKELMKDSINARVISMPSW